MLCGRTICQSLEDPTYTYTEQESKQVWSYVVRVDEFMCMIPVHGRWKVLMDEISQLTNKTMVIFDVEIKNCQH